MVFLFIFCFIFYILRHEVTPVTPPGEHATIYIYSCKILYLTKDSSRG